VTQFAVAATTQIQKEARDPIASIGRSHGELGCFTAHLVHMKSGRKRWDKW